MSGKGSVRRGCASTAVVLIGAPLVFVAGAYAGLAGFSCSGGVIGEGCSGGSWLPAVIVWVLGGLLVLWIASEAARPGIGTQPSDLVVTMNRPGASALVCKSCGAQNFQGHECWRCGRKLLAR